MKVAVSWFNVKDFGQAKKFYGDVLGLKKTLEMQQWAELAGAEGAKPRSVWPRMGTRGRNQAPRSS
jgi:predicted enzyme related to lactoylglutathione lyase